MNKRQALSIIQDALDSMIAFKNPKVKEAMLFLKSELQPNNFERLFTIKALTYTCV